MSNVKGSLVMRVRSRAVGDVQQEIGRGRSFQAIHNYSHSVQGDGNVKTSVELQNMTLSIR